MNTSIKPKPPRRESRMTTLERMLAQVTRFQREVLLYPVPVAPTALQFDDVEAFRAHIQEELDELSAAEERIGCSYEEVVAEEADALIDIAYIALGRLVRMGIVPGPAFDAVHEANMLKRPGRVAKRPKEGHDAVKPEGWTPADLRPYVTLTREDLLRAMSLRELHGYIDRVLAEAMPDKHPEDEAAQDHVERGVDRVRAAGIPVRMVSEDTAKMSHAELVDHVRGGSGVKLDDGKPPVWRGALNYFPRALAAVSMVSLFGNRKYDNWGGFMDVPDGFARYSDALGRHIVDEAAGGELPEADLPLLDLIRSVAPDATPRLVHMAQEAWNALARFELALKERTY